MTLYALPRFHVRTVAPQTAETMLVSGSFTRPEHVSLDDRGWPFVSETESTIADVVSADRAGAGLDVPNWSMTRHVHEAAVLPWLDCRWHARDLAFLLDDGTSNGAVSSTRKPTPWSSPKGR